MEQVADNLSSIITIQRKKKLCYIYFFIYSHLLLYFFLLNFVIFFFFLYDFMQFLCDQIWPYEKYRYRNGMYVCYVL